MKGLYGNILPCRAQKKQSQFYLEIAVAGIKKAELNQPGPGLCCVACCDSKMLNQSTGCYWNR